MKWDIKGNFVSGRIACESFNSEWVVELRLISGMWRMKYDYTTPIDHPRG